MLVHVRGAESSRIATPVTFCFRRSSVVFVPVFGSDTVDTNQFSNIRLQIEFRMSLLASRAAQLFCQLSIVEYTQNSLSRRLHVAAIDEKSCFAVVDQFRNAAHTCGDHWFTKRHRLRNHPPEYFF